MLSGIYAGGGGNGEHFCGNYPCSGGDKSAQEGLQRPKMQLNVSLSVTRITFLFFAETINQ
jgi:hypothetical protein